MTSWQRGSLWGRGDKHHVMALNILLETQRRYYEGEDSGQEDNRTHQPGHGGVRRSSAGVCMRGAKVVVSFYLRHNTTWGSSNRGTVIIIGEPLTMARKPKSYALEPRGLDI